MSVSTTPTGAPPLAHADRGALIGVLCYLFWGTFPIYFRQLQPAGAWEQLAHRVVWVFLLLCVLLAVRKRWDWIRTLRDYWRQGIRIVVAGALLTANWSIYVWAVDNDRVVDASLGYFITPLFAVGFGVWLLDEQIRSTQRVALGFGALSVVVLSAAYGQIPWVGLSLGITFALYGYLKKGVVLDPVSSLTVETAVFVVPALVFIANSLDSGSATFGHHGPWLDIKLIGLGPVSVFPLVLFGMAAARLPLVMIGLLQYISPCLQLLIGWGLYDEEMPAARLGGFVLIWAALVVLAADGWRQYRSGRPTALAR